MKPKAALRFSVLHPSPIWELHSFCRCEENRWGRIYSLFCVNNIEKHLVLEWWLWQPFIFINSLSLFVTTSVHLSEYISWTLVFDISPVVTFTSTVVASELKQSSALIHHQSLLPIYVLMISSHDSGWWWQCNLFIMDMANILSKLYWSHSQ